MALTVGETFAGFRIMGLIGVGGVGQVYLAQHPELPRQQALTLLSPEVTADPQYGVRFAREADLAAALSHPNILGVDQHGEVDGQFWISMDYAEGANAADLMRDRYPAGMPSAEVVDVVAAVASALDHAHHSGLLHGDVNPANILISGPDSSARRILLANFGIALPSGDSAVLTATDAGLDSVAYAAPEQLMGEAVDGRADQYALACTVFHLLTGALPYESFNAATIINKHVMAPPPSIGERRPEFARLDSVFATALAKDPQVRYPSCEDFASEFARQLASPANPEAGEATSAPAAAAVSAGPPLAERVALAAETRPNQPPPPKQPVSPRRVRVRRFSGKRWSNRKIVIAVAASVGILAMVGSSLAAMVMPLLVGGNDAPPTPVAAPTSTAPAIVMKPLAVRPVLDVPLQPTPNQCPSGLLPTPAQEPMQACAVDNAAVYRLGPVELQLNLTAATAAKLPLTEFHTVQMAMDSASSAAFAKYTAANVGKQLAFVRDGVVLAAPAITQAIDGQSLQISGELTANTAETIARMLRDGT